jgi:HAD superfamily hydrolase (TIGR01549 family)
MMGAMLTRPRALLLDFGGVIADAPPQPPAPAELVRRLHELIDGAVPPDQITLALIDGARAYAAWRDEISAQDEPAELSHAQVWNDFVACRWPAVARDAVVGAATPLSYAWTWRPEWALRPGMVEVLHAAAAGGVPVAVVSNTLCGAAHRDFLAREGLGRLFAAQLYSDEVGVRKPNPRMAREAARRLGVPVEGCWFVGDSPARDIACARRAGVGVAILMRARRTAAEQMVAEITPDATVDDGHGLLMLIDSARETAS